MSDHPYRSQPDRAFWARSVATDFSAADVYTGPTPLLTREDVIISAGSCFASNLVPYLEAEGFTYLRTETPDPNENLGYSNFSAAYGNIYTARQFLQLVERALGLFTPDEDRWHVDGAVIDPFRPGLRQPASSDDEFDARTAQHLAAVRRAIAEATVLVFTLGLTEAWRSRSDGAVYPACPGTVSGEFSPDRHEFHNFTAQEITDDLLAVHERLRAVNPELRVLLTVSPVPLVATATDGHVLEATMYSKSVLRTAAGEATQRGIGISYFPAYEIVCGPQAPFDYFEADRRNVSTKAVEAVMGALLAHCDGGSTHSSVASDADSGAEDLPPVSVPSSEQLARLSALVADAECDEELADDALFDS
jgi:GSCFA family